MGPVTKIQRRSYLKQVKDPRQKKDKKFMLFSDTLKRGDRRSNDADPGDKAVGFFPLEWCTFLEAMLPSHCTW